MEPNTNSVDASVQEDNESVKKVENSDKSLTLDSADDVLLNNQPKKEPQKNNDSPITTGNSGYNENTGNKVIINNNKSIKKDKITNYIYDFKPNTKKLFNFNDTELIEHANLLLTENVVVIDSIDYNVLLCALSNMASLKELKNISQKRLNFDKGNLTRADILFRNIIDEYIEKNENIFLIVFTNESAASANFFNQFLSNDFKASTEAYKAKLKEKKSFVVVAVGESKSIEALNDCDLTQYITRYQLSFVKYKLSNHYNTEEVLLLLDTITKQCKAGKWSKSDDEFYKEINRCLQIDKETFKKNILEKGNGKEDFGYDDLISKEKENFLRIINDEDPIIRYLSFVAVHFNDLTLSEFHYVMHLLLDDKNKIEIIDDLLKKDAKITRELLMRWNGSADTLIKKLQLKEIFSGKYDSRIVQFENSEFKELFEEQFLNTWSWFSQQQFNYLYFEKKLLLNDELPNRIFENFTRIAAKVAMYDPELYSRRLLLLTTSYILKQKTTISIAFDLYSEDLEDESKAFLEQLKLAADEEMRAKQREDFKKVSLLIAEMLPHEKLRIRINKFLNVLIEYKLSYIVLFFVEDLRNQKEFDPIYWLKEILDRSLEKKEAYWLLIKILYNSESLGASKMLEEIQKWYGSSDVLIFESSEAGLCSLVDYLFFVLQDVDYEELGIFPLKIPLFTDIQQEDMALKRIDFITSWFMHPQLESAYNEYGRFLRTENKTFFNEVVLAQLIILLKIVFTGLKRNSDSSYLNNETASKLGDEMICLLYDKADKIKLKKMKIGFKYWRDYYAIRMRAEQKSSKKDRELFQTLSRISGSLLNYFNKK